MNEITSIALENEMDLILAHKQSMRLAELTGLSIAGQTTFATAVSEVSRSAITHGGEAHLRLLVSNKTDKYKFITAVLEDNRKAFSAQKDEGFIYAKRLVSNISATIEGGINKTELHYRLPNTTRIDDALLEKWRINMNNDPAISPYEEIKRKNRELVNMANKLRESEQQYRTLTDSLPLMIMTLNGDGCMTYANRWVYEYSGETVEQLNENKWRNFIHPEDLNMAWTIWKEESSIVETIVIPETRLRNRKTGEYRWHTGVLIAVKDEDESTKCWNCFMVDVHAQKMITKALEDNIVLKDTQAQLEDKIFLLNQSNQQLEQFAYVASHDLQEPLRKISFYSDYLKNKFGQHFPTEAQLFFNNLIGASERMKILVQDILAYSVVTHESFTSLHLNELISDTLDELEVSIKEKQAMITIGELPTIEGNKRQLMQLFENLISNALKYSRNELQPQVNISAEIAGENVVISISDNGIGFDTQFLDRMFNLFQRLHSKEKYSGTGIGLAICKKIVDLHKGNISAHGALNQGATFIVTLPLYQDKVSKHTNLMDGTHIIS